MKYFVQTPKGEESGPFLQEQLIEMAKAGKISTSTKIRNSMMKDWRAAKSQLFLADIIKANEKQEVSGIQKNIQTEDNVKGAAKSLTLTEASIAAPELLNRCGAAVMDMAFIGIICSLLYQAIPVLGGEEHLTTLNNLWIFSCFAVFQIYYVFQLTYYAQTLGQRFFGIMIIQTGTLGKPVFAGRAYFFSLFILLTAPLNVLMILIFNRGLHEAFSGARIVNTRLG